MIAKFSVQDYKFKTDKLILIATIVSDHKEEDFNKVTTSIT